jgi:hypothetical protein
MLGYWAARNLSFLSCHIIYDPKSVSQKKNPKVCYKNMIQKRKKKKEKDDCHVRVQNCKQTKQEMTVMCFSLFK